MNGYFNEPWMDMLDPFLLERYWRHKGGREPVLIWMDYGFTLELRNIGAGEMSVARPKPPRAYYYPSETATLTIRRREMGDTCEEVEQESKFAALNFSLGTISDDLKEITKAIARLLDRLVGVATECEKVEKTPIAPSTPGLVGALGDRAAMLNCRVEELREQLNRVDGKF